jgi:phosphate:Na+ symporter
VAVAALTWAMHSSVAMVLLLAMLVQGGLLPMQAAVPMLMGANFGAGLIAVWLSRSMSAPARRVPLGNLILRGAFAMAALLAFWQLQPDLDPLGDRPEVQLVHLHLLFNAALLVLGLPFVPAVARLCAALVPEPVQPTEGWHRRISALDRSVIDRPALALASATRELLAMGDSVIEMFAPVIDVLSDPSAERMAALREKALEVGARHADIKLYLAEVNRNALSGDHGRRSMELTDLAINLERTCDVIARSVLPVAEEKLRHGLRFSDAGWADIRSLHARVRTNMQLAMNVLVSGDVTSARDLMREKERMRQLERDSLDRHLRRLSEGNPDSMATSHMHVQVIRALKEINSLLVTVTHPILAEQGMILESRLAPADASGL